MQNEIWKDIPGYIGMYQVSNLGHIKSIKRSGTKGCIMVPELSKDGYLRISLSKNGNYRKFGIHRLVAIVFIPNPFNFPIINHKNEIKTDNNVNNLEWCNYSYNAKYGTAIEKNIKSKIKSVLCFEQDNLISEHRSIADAARYYNIHHSNIVACLKKRRNVAGGFKWEYKF